MLTKSAKKLTKADIKEVEAKLKVKFPNELIEFYLKHNGGFPAKSYFYREAPYWGYTRIQVFYPIKFPLPKLETSLLEDRYVDFVERKIIAADYLPFAGDDGGNLFSININNYDISLIYTDLGEVSKDSISFLINGFNNFINRLKEEGDEEDV